MDAVNNFKEILMPYNMHKVPLFEKYLDRGKIKNLSKGDYLLQPAANDRHLYYIISGGIEVHSIREDGKDLFFYLAKQGNVFSRLFSTEDSPVYAIAAESCQVCKFSETQLRLIFAEDMDLCMEVMRTFYAKINYLVNRMMLIDSTGAPEKICRLLFNLCQHDAEIIDNDYRLRLGVSQKLLGDMLDIHPVTVSRIITILQDSGVITKVRQDVTVHDIDKLEELAKKGFEGLSY